MCVIETRFIRRIRGSLENNPFMGWDGMGWEDGAGQLQLCDFLVPVRKEDDT